MIDTSLLRNCYWDHAFRPVLRYSGYVFMWTGLLGFFLGSVCVFFNSDFNVVARRVRFPLGHPCDVVVDRQRHIYVGLAFYGRIQVYDAEGRFLYGFFADTNGGLFQMEIDGEKRFLTIVCARGDRVFTCTLDGTILSTTRNQNHRFRALMARSADGFVDRVGRRLVIRHAVIWPSIERIEGSDERSLRIKSPCYLWPIDGPTLSIVTTFFGYALVLVVNRGKPSIARVMTMFIRPHCTMRNRKRGAVRFSRRTTQGTKGATRKRLVTFAVLRR